MPNLDNPVDFPGKSIEPIEPTTSNNNPATTKIRPGDPLAYIKSAHQRSRQIYLGQQK